MGVVVCVDDDDDSRDVMETAGCLNEDFASSIEERGVVAVEEGVVRDIVLVGLEVVVCLCGGCGGPLVVLIFR